MFLHLSVSHSVRGGGRWDSRPPRSWQWCGAGADSTPSWTSDLQMRLIKKDTSPGSRPPLRSACWEIRPTIGRNASYWNAFLSQENLLRNKVVSFDRGRLGVLVCCIETTRRELGDARNIKCTEWPLKCRRVTSVRGVQGSQGKVIAVPSSPGIQSDITAVPSTPGIQVFSL